MDLWAQAGRLDRCENERGRAGWVGEQWTDPEAALLLVAEDGSVAVTDDGELDLAPIWGSFDDQRHYLLGRLDGRPLFVAGGTPARSGQLRALLEELDGSAQELMMAAVGLVNWHRTSPHCGRCGALTQVRLGGTVRHCPACGRDRFPRSDPAIIVAILDAQDRLLLGHQSTWPPGRMSLIAGFVSAGESLEQAVHREVLEETGVRVSEVRYLASQPWPFPRSLMLGFVARAIPGPIAVDEVEIEHARWFDRDELERGVAEGTLTLPGSSSIAQRIITAWRDGTLGGPEG